MKRKKIIKGIILLILIICLIFGFMEYIKINKYLTIKEGVLLSSELPTTSITSNYISKIQFDKMKVTEVKSITFDILNNKNIKDIPVLLKAQRYYIPVNYIAQCLGYSLFNQDNNLVLKSSSNNIILQDRKYVNGLIQGDLRGNIIKKDNISYISISDIEQVFNLTAIFNFKENKISLLQSNVKVQNTTNSTEAKKVSFLRLEDFTAGASYISDDNQTKVKCVADLLYSKGIKYHVSWIPRFKDPANNVDNDLLETDSIDNVGFINLLDYLINHNALVGLHGYTHQSGDKISGLGYELTDSINNTTEETKKVIENSIDTSTALNIKYGYFESPHYADDADQKKLLEDYFQYIFEPFDYTKTTNIYNNDNRIFVPAPLGYIDGNNVSKIIDGISSTEDETLTSFFYHPYLEYKFINFEIQNEKLIVNYDTNSPLHQVINALDSNKCTSIHIDELKQNATS